MQPPRRNASATRSRTCASSSFSGEVVSAPTPFSTPKARTSSAVVAQAVGWIESLSHDQTKLLTLPFQEPRICAGGGGDVVLEGPR